MRYHFVVNALEGDWLRQMEEMSGFRKQFLFDLEEGEMIVLAQDAGEIQKVKRALKKQATLLSAPYYLAEIFLDELCKWMGSDDIYIFGNDFSGNELAVRAAAKINGSAVTSVHGIVIEDEAVSVKKMVYSNHLEGTFCVKKLPCCISLAKGLEAGELLEDSIEIEKEVKCSEKPDFIVSRVFEKQENSKGMEQAKLILAAGRGVGSKEGTEWLEKIAGKLGGELGVSRPAAMNAWAPMNRLLGVSGAIVHPEICITAGASGAAAFYSGIEKSKFIAAINKDEKAPIMKKADVAIADDFKAVLEELEKLIEEQKGD